MDLAGDDALRLLLLSQSQDNCGVSNSSLISLLVKMHSNSLGASHTQRQSVLATSCCAAASFLTSSNASAYRLLLAKFGADHHMSMFIIFALGKIYYRFKHFRITKNSAS
jgi:hypothetical protein